MSLIKGSTSYTRFLAQVDAAKESTLTPEFLMNGLRSMGFRPIEAQGDEERSAGFVELEQHDCVDFSPAGTFEGDWLVCAWRIDTIRVSTAQLREELAAWSSTFEAEHHRPASRFEKSEAKDAIRRQLRDITPPLTKIYDITWNLQTHQVQVFCLSRKVVEEIQLGLEKAFDVRMLPRAPAVLFEEAGLQDASVKPTPELCLSDARSLLS